MGFFTSEHEQQAQFAYNANPQEHKGKFSHELIGGAAAFEAMKMYESHQAKNGQPPTHTFAKELIAGFAGAEVDKLFETKGLNFLDREKAKRNAQHQAVQAYDQQYGQ